jgi:transposase
MDENRVTAFDAGEVILAVSFELSAAKWKVALHDGLRQQPAVHSERALPAPTAVD